MKHFIQGFLYPFGYFGVLFQMPTSQNRDWADEHSAASSLSGFERDAANLRQDWINVGNYIGNAINSYEQESTCKKQ